MKKTLIAAALVVSLSAVAVACDDGDKATPEPSEAPVAEMSEAPAEAVESMAAEEVVEAEATIEAVEEEMVEESPAA